MTEQNERPETTQEEAGSTQEERTEREVEATDAAQRKAEELGIDLTTVQGTGVHGRVTVEDVENKPEQSEQTAKLAEVIQSISTQLAKNLQTLQPVITADEPLTDEQQDIIDQYEALRTVLAGPLAEGITKPGKLEPFSVDDPFPPQNFAPLPPSVKLTPPVPKPPDWDPSPPSWDWKPIPQPLRPWKGIIESS